MKTTDRLNFKQKCQFLIFLIDEKINNQVNHILHAAPLQRLEASWRGVERLLVIAGDEKSIIVKLLNVNEKTLMKDIERAVDFDQSTIFNKIYSEEFDQPGGQPYGLVIADYYFSHRVKRNMPDSIGLLQALAKIAASAFCPIVGGIAPSFFGIDNFSEIPMPLKIDDLMLQDEYVRWQQICHEEDMRFIGLTLPKVRMRALHHKETAIKHEDYLWGNACYLFAGMVIKSFKETGWFADMRGMQVTEFYREYTKIDEQQLIAKTMTEYELTDSQEKTLSDAGFLVAKDCRYATASTFYHCPSIQKLKKNYKSIGYNNAKLSSMLHYILCVSRFAHTIKVIIRDSIGRFNSAKECELFLDRWLHQYRAQNTDLTPAIKAKYPLTTAKVKVNELIGMPGKYHCKMYLQPHYQIDNIESQFKLTTELKLN